MQLHSLKIEGLRRIRSAQVLCGDATFLIGANNSGKSTVFKAIEYLLSGKMRIPSEEYYSIIDDETGETKPVIAEIILEAEFRNLPIDAHNWRGFKGRIFNYESDDHADSGLSVTYRKTFPLGTDVRVEFRSLDRARIEEYVACNTGQEFIDKGLNPDIIKELFPDLEAKIGKSKDSLALLEQFDDIWSVGEDINWFLNPGGIPGNVLKMLPRYILIPANTSENEFQGTKSGVLGLTLNELFTDVREASTNYKEAQKYLDELSKELDPEDEDSEFGKMILELNNILSNVFPDAQIHATADLSDPNTTLKPTFNIEMSSNVRTPVNNQGAGMIRSAAFGILRFRQKWISKKDEQSRSLIICFEEPEIYLHPSAANQMRDTIYELSNTDSQIIATTHSPFMIDLSRKPRQILNRMEIAHNGVTVDPFNVSESYKNLEADDKQHVKMILRIDDHIARVFFTSNVVIVEGDTDELVIRESLKRLPKEKFLKLISDFEIIKARGKAAIIGLAKYLMSMGIVPIIVHDRDQGIVGAEVFNEPIKAVIDGKGKLVQLHENIEDELGYTAPTSEKPYRAFVETAKWGSEWMDIPEGWRNKMKQIFGEYIPEEM